MLFTWTKSVVFVQAKSRLVSVLVVYLNRLPAFLAFTLPTPLAAGMFCYGDFCADVNKACCVSSPASVSWGGFWLRKQFGAQKIAKIKSLLFEKRNSLHFQKLGSVFNPMENVLVYDLDWDLKVSYQCDQVTPNRLWKRKVFATPNLEKDLTFSTEKKQWSNQWNKQWHIPGSYQRFACGFGKIPPSTWLKPLKTQQFFE